MGRKSKNKGKRGELELSKELMGLLPIIARRTAQYNGKAGDSDVVGIPGIHIECKREERLSIYPAIEQAVFDSKGQGCPTVFHRRNHKPWLVTFRLDDIVDFVNSINRVLNHADQCCTTATAIEAIAPDVASHTNHKSEGSTD